MSDELQFALSDRVEKHTGEARYTGKVVSVYETSKGGTSYVVEVEPQGFQMICTASMLRPAPPTEPAVLTYTNWRGETAMRTITPKYVYFGSTPWHSGEEQWLLVAFDHDRRGDRHFALKDFGATPAPVAGGSLTLIAAHLRYWIDHNTSKRRRAGLESDDDTMVMVPPAWPTHGQLKNWIAALEAPAQIAIAIRRNGNERD